MFENKKKVSCPACCKSVKVLESVIIDHQPPAKLSWLKTGDGICIGSGTDGKSEQVGNLLLNFSVAAIEDINDELAIYLEDDLSITVEGNYKGCEDPDMPVGRLWESYAVDDIICKPAGCGLVHYLLPMKMAPEVLIKIGSESLLLEDGLNKVISKAKREYSLYLDEQLNILSKFHSNCKDRYIKDGFIPSQD
jgi:hypothetical protein